MRRTIIAMAVGLLSIAVVAPPGVAVPDTANDPAEVAKWDAIAIRTAGALGAGAQLYLGMSSAAVYNAVVTIEGRFEPYTEQAPAKAHASTQAAVASAAHKVLRTLFPDQAAAIDADYEASIAAIPNGVGKVHGIRVGENAARAILQLREDDGRMDPSIVQTGGSDPGEWPGAAPNATASPMALAWLGFVDPLLIDSPTQFALHGPEKLDSAAYETVDLAEVQAIGAARSRPGPRRRRGTRGSTATTRSARMWRRARSLSRARGSTSSKPHA